MRISLHTQAILKRDSFGKLLTKYKFNCTMIYLGRVIVVCFLLFHACAALFQRFPRKNVDMASIKSNKLVDSDISSRSVHFPAASSSVDVYSGSRGDSITISSSSTSRSSAIFIASALLSSMTLLLPISAVTALPAWAAAAAAGAADAPLKVYKSGKNPNPPPKDGSKAGTKKDTGFLRCMSNCKTQCQKPGEGLAKSDCVQDCQDQCCDSYEQCSFKIKINTGTDI